MGAGVAQSVLCLTTDWTTGRSGFDPLQGQGIFSSNLCVQTGSGVHPASCQMGTGSPLLGDKLRPERGADHLTPSSA
jgi:hypothetical protein